MASERIKLKVYKGQVNGVKSSVIIVDQLPAARCIARERRRSSFWNEELVKMSLHCKTVVSFNFVFTEFTHAVVIGIEGNV